MITAVNVHSPVQSGEARCIWVPEGAQLCKCRAFPRLCSQQRHGYKTQIPGQACSKNTSQVSLHSTAPHHVNIPTMCPDMPKAVGPEFSLSLQITVTQVTVLYFLKPPCTPLFSCIHGKQRCTKDVEMGA